jgi:hypothetical protein
MLWLLLLCLLLPEIGICILHINTAYSIKPSYGYCKGPCSVFETFSVRVEIEVSMKQQWIDKSSVFVENMVPLRYYSFIYYVV